MNRRILVIGTFDSKQKEYEFLIEEIQRLGMEVLTLDIGTFSGGLDLDVDGIPVRDVVAATGSTIEELQKAGDRGQAMKVMSRGAAEVTRKLFREGRIAGVTGMGGSGGSSVIAHAMQALPIGIPKVLMSTMVGENSAAYVGCKDVILIPSITDVAGLNRISRTMIHSTAAAICGLVREAEFPGLPVESGKTFAISMFGNTTACVDLCRERLQREQAEVIVFHATGIGGRTMESLIRDGMIDGCLDITTTEIADEICGGILSAGADRLTAAGQMGIPQLVAPGCVDMVNFGAPETVPAVYRQQGRQFYEWNPSVTLMRTNVDENISIGRFMAEHLNRSRGPVQVLIPLRGVSILDGDGERFCDREADRALFETLKSGLNERIRVTELDCNINDPLFAETAVNVFLSMQREHDGHQD